MNKISYKLRNWYYNQNTFVRVLLHLICQAPYFIIGWLIGNILFKG